MEYSLGLIEVSALGNAIFVLDAMAKAADVEFVATERKLGGRLVTLVVRGTVSAVQAAIDAGKAEAERFNCLKAAEVIARPHPEILKFLHLDAEHEKAPTAESAATHVGAVPAQTVEEPQAAPKRTSSKAALAASDKKAPQKRGPRKK